jgi:hypothetical protein
VTVATAAAMALGTFALTAPALADSNADFVSTGNSSDPAAFSCVNPASPYNQGYCLVTSRDLSETPLRKGQLGENYYPMSQTIVYFSSDGLKWGSANVALNESSLLRDNNSALTGTKHLWAPTVRTLYTPGGRAERPAQNYFMYVPDLLDPEDRYTQRIWVTYSTSPLTGFGTTPIWDHPWDRTSQQILGIPTSSEIAKFSSKYPLYMSDPDVFTNTGGADDHYWDHEFDDYLLWADGDAASCGGMSLRKMTNQYTVEKFKDPKEAWLDIRGLNSGTDALGTCTKKFPVTETQTLDRPYLEGGELFHKGEFAAATTPNEGMPGPYILVFAAKPSKVPERCKSGGEPNTSNEVIAYATASTVTGPYTYQGIIMCGSSSEWTNQATIQQVKAPDGTYRLVLVHHDGVVSNDKRNRKLHSECLYSVDNKFVKTMRSNDGAASVSGSPSWCIANSKITALSSVSAGKFLSVDNSGNLKATGANLGVWEQLSRVTSGSYTFFKARNGNKFITTSTTQLNANSTTTSASSRFIMEQVSGTKYRIKDSNGRYLQTQSNGVVRANSASPTSNDESYLYWFQSLTN